MHRRLPLHRRPQAGFTLVELMVALGLSMFLATVLIVMQSKLGQQRVRTTDIAERDNQIRAAFDLMTQDASGSAYLFGNLSQPCDAIFTYNGTVTPRYAVRHPIDATAATSGSTMNFAPSLTLNYPTDGNPSDVLEITTSNDASNFNDLTSPQLSSDPTQTTTPLSTGNLQLTAPFVNAAAPAALSNMGLVATTIPNGALSQTACFRVPITTYTAATNQVYSAPGNYMPANFYAGFQASLTGAGFGTLGNGELLGATKFVDIGPIANPLQTTIAYYIDHSGNFPVLMRAQYSLLDDTAYLQPPQQIAAGVVSLQVRFNVGGGTYMSAAAMTGANWAQVCSVRIAVISRSLNDDADPNYSWKGTKLTPSNATNTTVDPTQTNPGAGFTVYTIPSNMTHRHYLLQTTELAVRNSLMAKGLTC